MRTARSRGEAARVAVMGLTVAAVCHTRSNGNAGKAAAAHRHHDQHQWHLVSSGMAWQGHGDPRATARQAASQALTANGPAWRTTFRGRRSWRSYAAWRSLLDALFESVALESGSRNFTHSSYRPEDFPARSTPRPLRWNRRTRSMRGRELRRTCSVCSNLPWAGRSMRRRLGPGVSLKGRSSMDGATAPASAVFRLPQPWQFFANESTRLQDVKSAASPTEFEPLGQTNELLEIVRVSLRLVAWGQSTAIRVWNGSTRVVSRF